MWPNSTLGCGQKAPNGPKDLARQDLRGYYLRVICQPLGIYPKARGIIELEATMSLLRREAGQGLAEYALILSLIAILAIAALMFLSGQINTILSAIGNAL